MEEELLFYYLNNALFAREFSATVQAQEECGLVDQLAHGLLVTPSLASLVLEVMRPESPASLVQTVGSTCQTTMQGDQDQHITTTRGASPEGMIAGCIPLSPSSFLAKAKKPVTKVALGS
jgi:hypothetical protein